MRTRQQQIMASRPNRRGSTAPPAGGGRRAGAPRRGGPTPLPIDSQALREEAEIRNEAGDTRAANAAKYGEVQEDLGYGVGAPNPYSQAADLARQREANERGIPNVAGNQLYSGSTLNAESQAERAYQEGSSKLQTAYDRATAAYERSQGATGRAYELGLDKIKEGALNRALATEPAPGQVRNGPPRQGRPGARPVRPGARPGARPVLPAGFSRAAGPTKY